MSPDPATAAIEEQLAEFASETRWRDMPLAVREYARSLTVDALANAVAGRTAETVREYETSTTALAGPGRHAVCAGSHLSAWGATGQNAYQMTVHTMCDVYRPALCHVTPEVVPAALAAAELAGASGEEFLLAVALGLEVTTRTCLGLDYPAFRARGWHSPGVAGAIGAAAAAGRLLGVDTSQLNGCLGLAGAQAAGTFAALGTVAVKFHQANGARAGLAAAVYASRGFSGSQHILTDADGGILRSYAGGGDPARVTAGLGESWELSGISMRTYPAASTLQALVDCLLTDQAQRAYRAGAVSTVVVWLPPHAYSLGAGRWDTQLSAMQSARFVSSATLETGYCWLDSFGPERRSDPRLAGFADQAVTVSLDSGLEEGAVRVRLTGPDGAIDLARDFPHGDSRDPLTGTEVAAKAERCLAAGLSESQCQQALSALTRLEHASTVTDLTSAVTV